MRDTPKADVSWYLFREGRQFGPISHIELLRLVEVGHVRGGDLLWKPGFSDWVVAEAVLPEVSNSTSALKAKRSATKTPIKKKQSSLLADVVGSLFNPILRFYRTAYDVTTTPTHFALHHIALNDRTSFFRGIRFQAESVSIYFVLLASVCSLSGHDNMERKCTRL